ncbi:MAG: FAD-binding oxidoreductase [Thermodesulfobacteriota bacterium]|nr:FAD-binding oxidoreductase [Thermodesulfobacteriota bacterium]
MAIAREAYETLASIVGSKYISEDPVVMEAYCGGRMGHGKDTCVDRVMNKLPTCVILPRTTKEVQAVVKVANRYKVPFLPASTYWVTHCAAKRDDQMIIDLKRMNTLEIDEKNMYAVVGSGVIYSQLQEEAMKRGLYTTTPGGGAQVSVLANHLVWGLSPLSFRNGLPTRRILGVEWVLPDGEIVRLGSLSMGDDPYWGEGPGPDLRGMLRGWIGWFGSLGVVTRMAVKLLPFQPERLEMDGISPDTHLVFPTNRMRWYNFRMPDRRSMVECMYEMGRCEISAASTKVPIFWRYIARSKTKEDFWYQWGTDQARKDAENDHILRVMIIGFTSEAQLEYEERVLMDIVVGKFGGKAGRTRQTDESWIKNADSAGMWWMTGGYVSVEGMVDTIDAAVKGGEALAERKKDYTPPLMEDYGDPGWFQVSELGHMGYLEHLSYFDPDDNEENIHKFDEWVYLTIPKEDIKLGLYNAFKIYESPLELTGKAYGPNVRNWMKKAKKIFDPNTLANPPVPADVDELVEKVDWLKKDW